MKQHDLDELKNRVKTILAYKPKTCHKNTIKLPNSHDVVATTKKMISFLWQ